MNQKIALQALYQQAQHEFCARHGFRLSPLHTLDAGAENDGAGFGVSYYAPGKDKRSAVPTLYVTARPDAAGFTVLTSDGARTSKLAQEMQPDAMAARMADFARTCLRPKFTYG